ncbi:MAG: protein kinase [Gemmataceae bacterium]|nr:protein kinase [Gemmataceae bacterium]
MADLDAATISQRVTMLGLVTEAQLRECNDEVDHDVSDAASLVRVLERKGFLSPWQTQKLLKGDKDGYFLGGYRILYRIASGTFGRVYRAEDPRTGVVAAVKVLRHRWSEDRHCIELFEREGKVGLLLRHPSIVQTLAVDRDPNSRQYYIVMEFVEGSNLRDFLAIRKKLPATEALGIMEECASALAFAFSKGLTHRDVKLTNVLINTQGRAKLTDFGLAAIYSSAALADDTKVDRTVDYAGLERATGVRSGDVRSDIFFLGCVLYEILSGRSPMEMTKNKQARMQKQRFHGVAPLTAADVEAQQSVFHLVETMMQIDPMRRHQTPAQLLEAIREVRRDVDGKSSELNLAATTRSVFVVEENEKLQDVIRTRFKEAGYRVLMSADPSRALLRFQQHPFDALILDAGSVGSAGFKAFRDILDESDRLKHPCACVLMLSESQAEWAERFPPHPTMKVLVRPVTLKTLFEAVTTLLPAE